MSEDTQADIAAGRSWERSRPDRNRCRKASAKCGTETASDGGQATYLLQLGSFRSSADAERLKAQLALKGIQTSIQTVTIDNGQTYHRVRTASYEKSQAQSMRAKLEDEGQESIMIRAR